jgi:hypothetical protein
MAFSLKTIQTHYVNDRPGNRRDRHIWHYCYLGEHEKCAVFGSLVVSDTDSHRTRVADGVRGLGETVYCECPCHSSKEVNP